MLIDDTRLDVRPAKIDAHRQPTPIDWFWLFDLFHLVDFRFSWFVVLDSLVAHVCSRLLVGCSVYRDSDQSSTHDPTIGRDFVNLILIDASENKEGRSAPGDMDPMTQRLAQGFDQLSNQGLHLNR